MFKKIFSVLGACIVFLSLTTTAYATTINDSDISAKAIIVCQVNGESHIDDHKTFEKYARSKGGTMYNSTCYTCACGQQIYLTDFGTYFFESETNWYLTFTGVPYAVPSRFYNYSGKNPPYWNIY